MEWTLPRRSLAGIIDEVDTVAVEARDTRSSRMIEMLGGMGLVFRIGG